MNSKTLDFKKSPAYSGFILCMVALGFYLLVQFIYNPGLFLSIRTYRNFITLFKSFTPLILLTMAQGLLMMLGYIDISIGIQMSFANVLAVHMPSALGLPTYLTWVIVVLTSTALGVFNGVIISKLRIPPLLAGFSMIYIVKGINLLIAPKPGGDVPLEANKFYSYTIFGFIPMSLIIIVVVFLGWRFLSKTRLMKQIYAVGGNERNAYISGIDTVKTKIKVYAIAGFLTGLAGICYTAGYLTGNPITGEIYGLQTISACILGGISLAGGWGTMSCALFGVSFQILIQNSVPRIFSLITRINGENYNTYYHNLLSDTIILFGLVITVLMVSRKKENLTLGIKKQLLGGGIHAK